MIKKQHKWRVIQGLKVASAIMFVAIFILAISNANQTKQNTEATKNLGETNQALLQALERAVIDINNNSNVDHDTQLEAIRCIVNLFGSRPGEVITEAEFDRCLSGTRLQPRTSARTAPNAAGGQSSTPNSQPNVVQSSPSPQPPQPPPPSTIQQIQDGASDALRSIGDFIESVVSGIVSFLGKVVTVVTGWFRGSDA